MAVLITLHYWDLTSLPITGETNPFCSGFEFLRSNSGIEKALGGFQTTGGRHRWVPRSIEIGGIGQFHTSSGISVLLRSFWRSLMKDAQGRASFFHGIPDRIHLFPLLARPQWVVKFPVSPVHGFSAQVLKFYIALTPWYFSTNLRVGLRAENTGIEMDSLLTALVKMVGQIGSMKLKIEREGTSIDASITKLFDYARTAVAQGLLYREPRQMTTRPSDILVGCCLPKTTFDGMVMDDVHKRLLAAHLLRQPSLAFKGSRDGDFAVCDRSRFYLGVSQHPVFHMNNWVGLRCLYESATASAQAVVERLESFEQVADEELRRATTALRAVSDLRRTPWDRAISAWDDLRGRDEQHYRDWLRTMKEQVKSVRERSGSMGTFNINMGNGAITIGNKNRVVAKINPALMRDDRKELGAAFALLRAEIEELGVPDKAKNKAARAVSDAEEEAAEEHPDTKSISESLRRMKNTLEAAGEVVDQAKPWVERLKNVGQLLGKVIPALAQSVSQWPGSM